jgi:hypothetical protein
VNILFDTIAMSTHFMRVEPKAPVTSYAPSASLKRSGSETFAVPGHARAGGPASLGAAMPLGTMEALLALQGEIDPKERRRRAVHQGQGLLDALDRLKAALLSGRVPLGDLKNIVSRLNDRKESSGDHTLDELLGQIELRAQVELAKLGQSS